jgi:hypothetical protein
LAAYDSAELREDLHERGTKPIIPNRRSEDLWKAEFGPTAVMSRVEIPHCNEPLT